ncbi:hypothetical protein PENTCL1PPCAC_8340, partial [Pristionchus entomophagus]
KVTLSVKFMMISKCCLRSVARMYSSTSCSSAAAAASTTRPRGTLLTPPSLLSSSASRKWKGCRDQTSKISDTIKDHQPARDGR